jgi:CrcB protein
VGLVGGFTTFSTFAWESLELIGSGRPWQATAYLLTSVSGGILAAVLGRLVAQELL